MGDESQAPLPRLFGLCSAKFSEQLLHALWDAGFTDQRAVYDRVFPFVPPEGIRLTALADRAGMTKQAMSELVGDLVSMGYLQRSPDPADGRAKLIAFTDRGWAAVETVLASFRDVEASLLGRLGERRMRELRRTLMELLDDA
ncbi:MAG: MarR family winged helix-turn-helix transcriptional regulator [Actinomycetes bacterium]